MTHNHHYHKIFLFLACIAAGFALIFVAGYLAPTFLAPLAIVVLTIGVIAVIIFALVLIFAGFKHLFHYYRH
ncbi:hypothetical protein JOC78_000808 [Bacillus ectoiniformans]|uniref:hypothetical protein n=1 Tax=Bacillus ectoiniformans TaxID=1494429 RepID=UPI001959806A|nr:hypothetical protein [Bacillus ectoiniformans]MBM7647868.1 hypothetical protein [Bacillus ectoiniformans]